VEPTEDQIDSVYTWVNIFGGIHAYTADAVPIEPDDEPFITRGRQHDITEYYSTAFLARHVGVGDGAYPSQAEPTTQSDNVLFSHYAARQVEEHISPLAVQQRWRSPYDAVLIDAFDGATPEQNELGRPNVSDGLTRSEETWTYRPGREEPRLMYRKAVSRRLVADSTGEFVLEVGGVATMGEGDSIQARVKGPDSGRAASFDVRVEFSDGTDAVVEGDMHIGPAPLLNRFTQLVLTADDLGVSRELSIERIAFVVRDGTLFVDDLRVVRPE
jgi:hypothetical protein